MGDEFTFIGPELLTTLLVNQSPCPMGDLKAVAFEAIASGYVLDRLSQQQMENLRRTIDVDGWPAATGRADRPWIWPLVVRVWPHGWRACHEITVDL